MGSPGSFWDLLIEAGHSLTRRRTSDTPPAVPAAGLAPFVAHGTTVIAAKYDGGVLNVGDRRATSESLIMYDRAEKIIPLDDHSLLAISGSFARAMEVVHYLRHSFKYYARTQLQSMSLEGKLSELGRLLSQNLSDALSGIGFLSPLFSAYDPDEREGRIYFFDGMGARFEAAEFAAAGSGSHRIRGAFDYVLKTKGRFGKRALADVLHDALVLLDIAADLDAATGGYGKVLPLVKTVSGEGVGTLTDEQVAEAIRRISDSGCPILLR